MDSKAHDAAGSSAWHGIGRAGRKRPRGLRFPWTLRRQDQHPDREAEERDCAARDERGAVPSERDVAKHQAEQSKRERQQREVFEVALRPAQDADGKRGEDRGGLRRRRASGPSGVKDRRSLQTVVAAAGTG